MNFVTIVYVEIIATSEKQNPHLISNEAVKVCNWWKSLSPLQVEPGSTVYYFGQNYKGGKHCESFYDGFC